MTLACIRCGCTDDNACMTADGPCAWVSRNPPICSACIESEVGEPDCPKSISGLHQPLFRADSSAYCVLCKAELDTPEAA